MERQGDNLKSVKEEEEEEMRKNFTLDDEEKRRFCLCDLGQDTRDLREGLSNPNYLSAIHRDRAWKILKIYETLSSNVVVNEGLQKYMEILKDRKPLEEEQRKKLFKILKAAHKEVLKFSKANFAPTLVYLKIADSDGMVKEEMRKILKEIKIHTYVACLTPATLKFHLCGNFSFEEFLERITPYNLNIPPDCWDFHNQQPYTICDE